MIIYLPCPEVLIDQITIPDNYQEIEYHGVKMVIERCSLTQGRIVRLLSTNPQDYLHPDYQPGSIVNFK